MEFLAHTFVMAVDAGGRYVIVEASFNDHRAVPTIATKLSRLSMYRS